MLLLIFQCKGQTVGLIVDVRSLDVEDVVLLFYCLRLAICDGKSLSKVAHSGAQS